MFDKHEQLQIVNLLWKISMCPNEYKWEMEKNRIQILIEVV